MNKLLILLLFTSLPTAASGQTEPVAYDQLLQDAKADKKAVAEAFAIAQAAIDTNQQPLQQVNEFTDALVAQTDAAQAPIGFKKFGREKNPDEQENSIYSDPIYIRNAALLAGQGVVGRAYSFGPGAFPVSRNAFPECVAIGRSGTYIASGVLISGDLVLTCAHIWDGSDDSPPDSVWLGNVTPDCSVAIPKGKFLAVKRCIRHPGYKFAGSYQAPLGNDIMLLEIDTAYRSEIKTNAVIAPLESVALLGKEEMPSVRAVGFGNSYLDVSGSPRGFGVKRHVTIPVASGDASMYGLSTRTQEGTTLTTEFVAASKTERSSTCTGDSGGPVYISKNGVYEVIGLTSRSTPSPTQPCGADGAIYTIVPYFMDWIQSASQNRSSWTLVE